MIEELKKNISTELSMLKEITEYNLRLKSASVQEAKLLNDAIRSLRESMRIINSSIPEILAQISAAKKLPSGFSKKDSKKTNLENIKFRKAGSEIDVVLNKRDKERFLKELDINEQLIKKLNKSAKSEEEKYQEFKASRGYIKLANRLFLQTAGNLVRKGHFKELSANLRKANLDLLVESYAAMMILSVVISFFASVIIVFLLVGLDTVPIWPFIELRTEKILAQFVRVFWLVIAIPMVTFISLYFYPSTEKSSLGKKIDQELPFAVIHMSAISGSGIEPSEIFKIIGLSKEYPFLRKEIRKVLNQINLYGYDLTTALTNASKTAPSEKLSELFSGLSTTITSGAKLPEFFEKRAETLLLGYRLEREKYTKIVETFLDIYISVVIAAPMIFLLLLVMMAISGLQVGLNPFQLSVLAVSAIALLNITFLIILHIKQPTY